MRTVICCQTCFENIARQNTKAAKLWMDLCGYYIRTGGLLGIMEYRIPKLISAFKYLEQMGYITTADAPVVKFRIEGHQLMNDDEDDLVDGFCINREEHGVRNE